MAHQSLGNEVTPDGIVHRCSCGWVSRPCFSNMIASIEGQDHREATGNAGVEPPPAPSNADALAALESLHRSACEHHQVAGMGEYEVIRRALGVPGMGAEASDGR